MTYVMILNRQQTIKAGVHVQSLILNRQQTIKAGVYVQSLIADARYCTCFTRTSSQGPSPRVVLSINGEFSTRYKGAWIAQSVQRLATRWTVRGSKPCGGGIFRTRPDRPWGPPRLLYNGYRVFPRGKAVGAWR
jgi:hypothetical protein